MCGFTFSSFFLFFATSAIATNTTTMRSLTRKKFSHHQEGCLFSEFESDRAARCGVRPEGKSSDKMWERARYIFRGVRQKSSPCTLLFGFGVYVYDFCCRCTSCFSGVVRCVYQNYCANVHFNRLHAFHCVMAKANSQSIANYE